MHLEVVLEVMRELLLEFVVPLDLDVAQALVVGRYAAERLEQAFASFMELRLHNGNAVSVHSLAHAWVDAGLALGRLLLETLLVQLVNLLHCRLIDRQMALDIVIVRPDELIGSDLIDSIGQDGRGLQLSHQGSCHVATTCFSGHLHHFN